MLINFDPSSNRPGSIPSLTLQVENGFQMESREFPWHSEYFMAVEGEQMKPIKGESPSTHQTIFQPRLQKHEAAGVPPSYQRPKITLQLLTYWGSHYLKFGK